MKIGVEVEYWVVDETGRLCTGRDLLGAHEHVVPEFVEPLVEIQTSPLDDESAIRRELQQTLRTVLAAAEARGKHLVPLGTPLTAEPMSVTSKRGEILERIYGNRLDYAKHCAGTHLHFDKGTITRQLNLLTALDPALSLLSSSPYYDGERVASSARASVYRCKSDPEMAPYRDLWKYTTSVGEWNQRIATRHRALRTTATERGVPLEAFDAWFTPEDSVQAPVRLQRGCPTVEWRAPDTALPSQILQLVNDVSGLLRQTADKPIVIGDPGVFSNRIAVPSFGALRRLEADAIAEGLRSASVREYLERMTFDTAQYQPLSDRFPTRRRIGERSARRLRLAAAERLRDDVDSLRQYGPREALLSTVDGSIAERSTI